MFRVQLICLHIRIWRLFFVQYQLFELEYHSFLGPLHFVKRALAAQRAGVSWAPIFHRLWPSLDLTGPSAGMEGPSVHLYNL